MISGRPLARLLLGAAAALGLGAASAYAAAPQPWQMYLQPPVTPMAEQFMALHNQVLSIMAVVCVLVLGLLVYVVIRFRASRNPVPSRTAYNTTLEVLWTAVPVIILVVIAVPSFRLLYFQDRVADADMTLKVIGHQWYWSYEYPDHDGLTFDANMIFDEDIGEGQKRLRETDNRVVLPVDTNIRLLFTSTDVLHSWAVPAFGVKMDSVPGRINESWVRVTREGTYFGQCSELCGPNHGFMPIAVEVVSKEAFAEWVEAARKEFAGSGDAAGVAVVNVAR